MSHVYPRIPLPVEFCFGLLLVLECLLPFWVINCIEWEVMGVKCLWDVCRGAALGGGLPILLCAEWLSEHGWDGMDGWVVHIGVENLGSRVVNGWDYALL